MKLLSILNGKLLSKNCLKISDWRWKIFQSSMILGILPIWNEIQKQTNDVKVTVEVRSANTNTDSLFLPDADISGFAKFPTVEADRNHRVDASFR